MRFSQTKMLKRLGKNSQMLFSQHITEIYWEIISKIQQNKTFFWNLFSQQIRGDGTLFLKIIFKFPELTWDLDFCLKKSKNSLVKRCFTSEKEVWLLGLTKNVSMRWDEKRWDDGSKSVTWDGDEMNWNHVSLRQKKDEMNQRLSKNRDEKRWKCNLEVF